MSQAVGYKMLPIFGAVLGFFLVLNPQINPVPDWSFEMSRDISF